MTIANSQSHQVFFEESQKKLENMEQVLRSDNDSVMGDEAINVLFRAAHSIKMGASTLEFDNVAGFMLGIESLLSQFRMNGENLTAEIRIMLLEAVDVAGVMLQALNNNEVIDQQKVERAQKAIQSIQHVMTKPVAWKISFKPNLTMLKLGYDPVRLFQQLNLLGQLEVTIQDEALPSFSELEPDRCYLSWHLTLVGKIHQHEIEALFAGFEAHCELLLEQTDLFSDIGNEEQVQALQMPLALGSELLRVQDKDSATASSSENAMRVDTDKVDALLNLVGELAITQSMLSQISHHFELSLLPKLNAGIARLEYHARDMQQAVMQMQMLPISNAFNFLSRRVQNLADSLGKKVNFKVSGEKVELDKTILEQVIPPLSHLIRNAMEQGFENPDVRSAAGKSATGLLQLKAYSHGSHIIIEVSDDGAGLDEVKILQKAIEKGLVSESEVLSTKAIHKLIFQSGFSTTDNISEFSGDITGAVSENIRNMGGSIEVMSEIGKGTVFTLRLPVTLAIIEGQTIKVAEQHYILPLTSIIESFEIEEAEVQQVLEKGELYPFHGDYIPILRLYQLFNLSPTLNAAEPQLLIIVEAEGDKVALYVDELISQQHVVIKSLETHYQKVIGFSGATITGNGNVTLILDISALIKHYKSGGSTVFLSDEEETIA